MMALHFNRIDWITILWNHAAEIKLRSFPNSQTALEYACQNWDEKTVSTLLGSSNQIKQINLEHNKDDLLHTLEQIPDFELDMTVEWKSSLIPLIGSVTPSDTFKLYKKGSSVRIDFSLSGFKNLKSQRGDMSILFKGRDSSDAGEIFVNQLFIFRSLIMKPKQCHPFLWI